MVKITDGYFFEVDGKQFTLYAREKREKIDFKTRKPTGEIIEADRFIGYYMSASAMLIAAADDALAKECANGQIETIHEYLERYREIVNDLRNAVQGATE